MRYRPHHLHLVRDETRPGGRHPGAWTARIAPTIFGPVLWDERIVIDEDRGRTDVERRRIRLDDQILSSAELDELLDLSRADAG